LEQGGDCQVVPSSLIVIVGPTASGKSRFALSLAKELDGEIVGCDSVQLYRLFDIGSAKATHQERQNIPHHLIDKFSCCHDFDAGQYRQLAREVIANIQGRGKIPIVVGGTGLYLRALLDDRWHHNAPKDEQLRKQLEKGRTEELYEELSRMDPERAGELHSHDRFRVIRALELNKILRKPVKTWQNEQVVEPTPFRSYIIHLQPSRATLHKNIEERVQSMLSKGLLDEVRDLLREGCKDTKPMQSIGYKQAISYLSGNLSYRDLSKKIVIATRQYAKHQTTWFKKQPINLELQHPLLNNGLIEKIQNNFLKK